MDFGAYLRQAREQRGVSLHEIADRTKISVLALGALERNDASRLPGGIFTRAFVRAYAAEVGLDPEDAVRRFLARFPDQASNEIPRLYDATSERISVDESSTPRRAWRAIAWSIPILLVVAYFGFGGRLRFWQDQPGQRAEQPAAAVVPPAAQAAKAAPLEPQALPSAAGEPVAPATGGQSIPSASGPGTALVSDAPAAAGPAPVPAAPPPGPGQFRVTLAPREACWVQLRMDGTIVFSGLMQPGERRDVTVGGEVVMTVGNAGVFEYLVNGQPGRALGAAGQVVTQRMTAANLATFMTPR